MGAEDRLEESPPKTFILRARAGLGPAVRMVLIVPVVVVIVIVVVLTSTVLEDRTCSGLALDGPTLRHRGLAGVLVALVALVVVVVLVVVAEAIPGFSVVDEAQRFVNLLTGDCTVCVCAGGDKGGDKGGGGGGGGGGSSTPPSTAVGRSWRTCARWGRCCCFDVSGETRGGGGVTQTK